jgi:hypothetical protein
MLTKDSGKSLWHGALSVFSVSLAARLILDAWFQLRFGAHAVNHVEAWFYTGVLEGTMLPANGVRDPTVWLLRAVGAFLPSDAALYGVFLASALLSSLTALALYFLASELYDRKCAFAAGLVYGGMVEPLGLSMSGFTHDHLQLLLIVAGLYSLVRAFREEGLRRLVCVFACALVVCLGLQISEVMWVGASMAFAYACFRIIDAAYGGKGHDLYRLYLILLVLALLAFRLLGAGIIEERLGVLPQGRMGSADVTPMSITTFWFSYNVLLFILPFGILSALGRKDVFGLSLAAAGFMLASVMSRGARVADLGVALLAAYALVDWDSKAKTISIFSKKARLKTTAAYSAFTFIAMSAVTGLPVGYTAAFLLSGVAFIIMLSASGGRTGTVLSILVLSGLAVNVVYIHSVYSLRVASEAEYRILKGVGDGPGGGKILTSWDKGYMAEAVSGLEAASTPGGIDRRMHDLLWMPERQAALNLRLAGVRYVLLTGDNFNVGRGEDGRMGFSVGGGLVFEPESRPKMGYVDRIALFRLRYNSTAGYFRLLSAETDPATSVQAMLYEVEAEAPPGEEAGSYVGALFENSGVAQNMTVDLAVHDSSGAHSYVFNQSFDSGGIVEAAYPISQAGGYNCTLAVRPAPGSALGGVKVLAVFC